MKKQRVLVFPGGSEIGLEINNALKYSKFVDLIAGTSVVDHSYSVYNEIITLPNIKDDNFITELNNAIEKNNIDIIFPALDIVQLYLAKNMNLINSKIVTPDYETVKICSDKNETYKYFKGYDFIPKTYQYGDEFSFPVFIKPKIGCGSIGAKKINNLEELKIAYDENKDIVISEYLPGKEYTVDCFTDKNGILLVNKIRSRDRTKTGISVRSELKEISDDVIKIANVLNDKLKFKGVWFFQLKKDINDKMKLMEVSARVPGTLGLSRNTGINFALLSLYVYNNEDVSIIDNSLSGVVDRAFINRYKFEFDYDTVYIDFDDTIVLSNGKVNKYLMMFLYQCINTNKKIILITKHKNDIKQALKNYKIDESLFDKIIHINEHDQKYNYITEKSAIFIDDSFAERKIIKEKLNIPVFDLDMIESLIDWRM